MRHIFLAAVLSAGCFLHYAPEPLAASAGPESPAAVHTAHCAAISTDHNVALIASMVAGGLSGVATTVNGVLPASDTDPRTVVSVVGAVLAGVGSLAAALAGYWSQTFASECGAPRPPSQGTP